MIFLPLSLFFFVFFCEGLFPHPPLIAYDFVYSGLVQLRPMHNAGMLSHSKWCLPRASVGISCQERNKPLWIAIAFTTVLV
ncbi:unnamed protein product [Spirodela intermedia]|uniref:Secreted protein n=1 Tax=Spirodela intermedia TaxID=51605 RepID=A0ABN7ECR5_SPIIN|nr:unnamed protein product [Spirodela intermedia]